MYIFILCMHCFSLCDALCNICEDVFTGPYRSNYILSGTRKRSFINDATSFVADFYPSSSYKKHHTSPKMTPKGLPPPRKTKCSFWQKNKNEIIYSIHILKTIKSSHWQSLAWIYCPETSRNFSVYPLMWCQCVVSIYLYSASHSKSQRCATYFRGGGPGSISKAHEM